MTRQEPAIGMVYVVRSEEWGEETFVLVASAQDSVPSGYQPVNIRARFGEFLLSCREGERRWFVGHGGEAVEYKIVQITSVGV
jgi:hypothetical protein